MKNALSAVLPAVLLVAIALWEIVATARARHQPSEADWTNAEAAVRAEFQPGDLIVFAPDWIDPIGREHLGDLIPVEVAARADASRFAVIWEVSIRGAHAPDTRGLAAVSSQSFGDVTVRRFEQEPSHVVADFVSLAPQAHSHGGAPTVELAEVGFAPHRCVQVVPQPDQTVALDFGVVPLGDTLVGYAGLADVFTRRDVRDPGRLDIAIDGQLAGTVTVGVDDGWRRFVIDTARGEHRVEIDATAVGPHARDRRICFALEARR